jgi:two-component system nitrate/nitrite response regulator NarL
VNGRPPPNKGTPGVAIRSGRRLFRDALAAWLTGQPDLTLVGHVADDNEDLFELCQLVSPDLVLFDVGSCVTSELKPLAALRARFRQLRVVVLYEQLSPEELALAWKVGVDALIPYSHGLDALLLVLLEHGRAFRSGEPGPGNAVAGLTDDEVEILTLIGGGHTVGRIAELLGLTPCTVENAKRRIFAKLRVANQTRAIARAAAMGLVTARAPVAAEPARLAGPILAVLRGPDTVARRDAVVPLLSNGISFVIDNGSTDAAPDEWGAWHAGPVLLVLVDPRPQDWEVAGRLPVLLVRSTPVPRVETLDLLARGVVALLAGARVADTLVPALTLANLGHIVIDPAAAPSLVAVLRMPGEPDKRLPELTVREFDMLASIAQGHTVRETARHLGIAVKTVENTQARLFLKLGAHSRAAAVAQAHRLGLLDSVPAQAGAATGS